MITPRDSSGVATIQRRLQDLLIGASIQRVAYSVASWELQFLGDRESDLWASELEIRDPARSQGSGSASAKSSDANLGCMLIASVNGPRVSNVTVMPQGDLEITMQGGVIIRCLGAVKDVDWTWSVKSGTFQFTWDGVLGG